MIVLTRQIKVLLRDILITLGFRPVKYSITFEYWWCTDPRVFPMFMSLYNPLLDVGTAYDLLLAKRIWQKVMEYHSPVYTATYTYKTILPAYNRESFSLFLLLMLSLKELPHVSGLMKGGTGEGHQKDMTASWIKLKPGQRFLPFPILDCTFCPQVGVVRNSFEKENVVETIWMV